jgi:hypothetical protein
VSTFLWGLGVVVPVIAGVVWIALSGPEQPARTPKPTSRGARAAARAAAKASLPVARPAPSPPRRVALPAGGAMALPDGDGMRLRALPAAPVTVWMRIRSGIVLMLLIGILGALLALAVGGVLVGLALAIRSATG